MVNDRVTEDLRHGRKTENARTNAVFLAIDTSVAPKGEASNSKGYFTRY